MKENKENGSFTSGGFRIAKFGGKRHALQSSAINELVKALNIFGALTIIYDDKILSPQITFSDANAVIQIPRSLSGDGAALTVEEADASPSVSDVNKIVFPNGSVTDNGGGEVEVSFSAAPIPFEIYQTSTWLKYKVKTGYVITAGNPIIPTAVETEFTLTSGVGRYWLYLDITSTTAEVKKSSTTLTWSVNLVPIGWVDTQTDSATTTAHIYQFVKDHVLVPCA